MPNPIELNAATIIKVLFESNSRDEYLEGKDLTSLTTLSPSEINDAVDFLSDRDLVERLNFIGTAPFEFGGIKLSSRGKYIYHELKNPNKSSNQSTQSAHIQGIVRNQPLAAGSPYGFTDQDWEYVQSELKETNVIKVVFGYQFISTYYDSNLLFQNLKSHFETAVLNYNAKHKSFPIQLNFLSLGAAYGEHLFNHIAREIISADIAVFDASDRNPNVMLEMGVALTWGKRVLPILEQKCEKPPSDISGHTYAQYTDSGKSFSETHEKQMLYMIEHAVQKKGRI